QISSSETVGALSVLGGSNAINTFRSGPTTGNTLTFTSFGTRASGATLLFTEIDLGITPPTGNPTSKVLFTNAPALVNGILGGWSASWSRINVSTTATPQYVQMLDFTTIES